MSKHTYIMSVAVLAALLATPPAPAFAQQEQHNHDADPEEIPYGLFNAELVVPGGTIPFQIELGEDHGNPTAVLINGPERVRIDKVEHMGKRIRLFLPAYNTTILASRTEPESYAIRKNTENPIVLLKGAVRLVKRGGKEIAMPFNAVLVTDKDEPPVVLKPAEVDLTGRWETTFTYDDGRTHDAIGDFKQNGNKLSGTFLKPSGDDRYLHGEVEGRKFFLGTFDGSNVYLFKGTVSEDDKITGEFWSETIRHETWTGVRNPDAKLPDATTLTHLKEGYDRVTFTFPDTKGNDVAFPSPAFEGKVVIVTIGGTWCANCADEAVFLTDLYEKYASRGFDIIGLMYEHYRDFDKAARQVDRFRNKHSIRYNLLVAGYSDSKEAAASLPMIDHVIAYPTMMLIERDGTVNEIHTGFNGPGTGKYYEDFVAEFTKRLEGLLAEKP